MTATSEFGFPLWIDLVATALYALTGAAVALRQGYDYVGVFGLAFVTGIGGAILRDGVFLQHGTPPALRDWHYIASVGLAAGIAVAFAPRFARFDENVAPYAFVEPLGLGLYCAIGVQDSLDAHLGWLAAVLVGALSGVGSGVIRDVLVQRPVTLFQPSQLYGIAAVAGCLLFVLFEQIAATRGAIAGTCAVVTTATIRMLAVRFNWRTPALKVS